MSSLKGYTPALARTLGTTADALYERQRALVRAGLLDAGEGRGPGSGVRATGPSVALLLLSVLATDRLTGSEARVRALAGAQPRKGKRCPYTHMRTLLDAFAAVLVTTGRAAGVTEITVSRTADWGAIRYYDDDGNVMASIFDGDNPSEPGLSISATLHHSLLIQIAQDVQAIVLAKFDGQEGTQ